MDRNMQGLPFTRVLNKFLESETRTMIFTLDRDGRILSSNGGLERLFDLRGGFSAGKSLFDFILPENASMVRDIIGNLPEASPEPGQCIFRRETLNFRHGSSAVYTLACFFSRCEGVTALIAEPRRMSDSEIIIRMTELNNELSSLSRELTRKNVELEKANVTINRLLNTDMLTGIANRRALMDFLSGKIEKEDEMPLSLIMADIDHFKKVNDNLGHHAGDGVLASFGRTLADQIREKDLCGRYGGEEFLIVLPRTALDEAVSVAERIRKAVEATGIGAPPVRITASFGVAASTGDEGTDSLIGRADEAMYRAKALGRNRVVRLD